MRELTWLLECFNVTLSSCKSTNEIFVDLRYELTFVDVFCVIIRLLIVFGEGLLLVDGFDTHAFSDEFLHRGN